MYKIIVVAKTWTTLTGKFIWGKLGSLKVALLEKHTRPAEYLLKQRLSPDGSKNTQQRP